MAIKTNESFMTFSNSVTFRKPRGTDLLTASELIPGFYRSKSNVLTPGSLRTIKRPAGGQSQASNPRPLSALPRHGIYIDRCIIYKILLLVYKAINGLSQSYISSLHSFCSSSYSLRSYSNKFLQVPRSKLKSYGDRRFSIAGPKLWNSIPASLRNTDSLNSFKKHLKTFILPSFFLIYKQIFIHFSYLYMQLLEF